MVTHVGLKCLFLGQGSGKLEKAEILELTVDYLKSLQSQLNEQQDKDAKKGEGQNSVSVLPVICQFSLCVDWQNLK